MSKYFFIWIAISILFLAAEIAFEASMFMILSVTSLIVGLGALASWVTPDYQIFFFGVLGILGLFMFRAKLIFVTVTKRAGIFKLPE